MANKDYKKLCTNNHQPLLYEGDECWVCKERLDFALKIKSAGEVEYNRGFQEAITKANKPIKRPKE